MHLTSNVSEQNVSPKNIAKCMCLITRLYSYDIYVLYKV